jgi:hypothetical protein
MAGTAGVYTLTVGAPVAAASNIACVQNAETLTTTRAVLTSEPDTWVRVKLPYYTKSGDSKKFISWKGAWYRVTESSSGYTATPMQNVPFDTWNMASSPSGYLYGLLDFRASQSGDIQVYPENQVVQQAVTGTCLVSAAPALPKPGANNVISLP